MQYKQLQAFLAVIEKGSFSQAAMTLQVSQPSISRLIKDLQDCIGFELFQKQKGRMIPTAEAMAFYEEVKGVVHGIHHLENFAENLKQSTHGSLTIGSTPALATQLTPTLIRHFVDENPDVHISLLTDSVDQLMRGLRHAKYDLILTNHADYHSGFIEEPLIDVDWVCVLQESHPLAQKDVITPTDLNGENLLKLIDEDGMEWHSHKSLLKEHNIKIRSQFSTQRSLSGYGMVAAGLCIALLDPFNASMWTGLNVVTRPFRPQLKYRYTMYYSADHIRSKLSREFSACAKRNIKKMPLYKSIK
tara:strand:+ start:47711 stop:48619 length:909 start_codon:yes stop_codon:yes gene_type:complete